MHIRISSESKLNKYPAKQHALRVAQALGVEEGLIYLPGAQTILLEDSDQARPFRQRRYFYYLSGVNEADCLLTYDINHDKLSLWLKPINARQVVWTGRGSTIDEAHDKYDIDNADYSNELVPYLKSWASNNAGDIYVLHPQQSPQALADKHHKIDVHNLQPAMDQCRVIKDDYEIDLIKRANTISAKAHEDVLRKLRGFSNEGQVEARFLDVCIANGAKHQAYDPIAGSGENAAVLHYGSNDEDFGDRQLMCLDAGAEWDCYASDVTRTFPLSGSWPSKECKDIYALVQKMQESAMAVTGPGKDFLVAHLLAHHIAVEGLLQLGILHNGTIKEILEAGTSLAFYPHGLGHHLGLEVHDVSPTTSRKQSQRAGIKQVENYATQFPFLTRTQWIDHLSSNPDCRTPCSTINNGLEPGMVITVEPGIYFNQYALKKIYLPDPVHAKYINKSVLDRYMAVGGVRIEDDILITKTGWTNLTTAAKGEKALRIIRGEE